MAVERVETLIAGGGIGGLASALALARAGRRVQVIERASEFAEIGAGLQMAPNATRVLDKLGVFSEIEKHAVFPARLVWMDALRQEKITEVDLGQPFLKHFGYPYIVMHRSDLLQTLLDACKAEKLITLEANRELAAAHTHTDAARALLADGGAIEADALIGADGLHSKVRAALVNDRPFGDGYVAYRGTLPMSEMMDHAGLDNVVMWVGPDMHFVQYPVRRGEVYNQVAVFRSKKYRPGMAPDDDWGGVDEFDAHYAQCCEYVRRCASLMWRDRRWPMFDREPILTWTLGRIALLGDAAHAMFQYIAQGACQAILDADALGAILGSARRDDVPKALVHYERARALQAARVQITARAMGRFFHMQGVPAQVRNAMMRARPATDYSQLDWLYGEPKAWG